MSRDFQVGIPALDGAHLRGWALCGLYSMLFSYFQPIWHRIVVPPEAACLVLRYERQGILRINGTNALHS